MVTRGSAVKALDLFAGPGGWDSVARELGLDMLGIEYDDAACATREAAGLRTLHGDVAALDPNDFSADLLIASPPCQAWSMAGKRGGERDKGLVYEAVGDLSRGVGVRADLIRQCEDSRSMLAVEPLRWALALRPSRIAWEQVPPVLELWRCCALILAERGYSVWTGILSAERYGVPQTRKRAILMASLDGPVSPPEPTHQAYVPGQPAQEQHGLFGSLLPWVSMAEALGWTDGQVGFPRRADDGAATEDGYRERDFRDTDEPAFNVTEKARSWSVRTNNFTAKQRDLDGKRTKRGSVPYEREADAPAPTVDTSAGGWSVDRPAPTIVGTRRSEDGMLVGRQLPEGEGRNVGGKNWPTHMAKKEDRPERVAQGAGNRPRPLDAPAATLDTRTDLAEWVTDRPATTVQGDERIAQPGHKGDAKKEPNAIRQMEGAIRVTEQEAATLQGFPPDYPFQGSRSQRFQQIGNAVPPPLARAILEQLVGARQLKDAA